MRRFRKRFGRGFDAAAAVDAGASEEEIEAARVREEESLMDMMGGFGEPPAVAGGKKGKKGKKAEAQSAKGGEDGQK